MATNALNCVEHCIDDSNRELLTAGPNLKLIKVDNMHATFVASSPPPESYDRFLNITSASRSLSALRKVFTVQMNAGPDMIALAGGTLNAAAFPFKSLTLETKNDLVMTFRDTELANAFHYTTTAGFPPLMDLLVKFQKRMHDPPYARQNPMLNQMTTLPGCEDGMCRALEMIVERGDPVLIQEPAYPGLLAILKPYNARPIVVDSDEHGVRPDSMEKALAAFSSNGYTTQNGHAGQNGHATQNGHTAQNGHAVDSDDDPPQHRRPKVFVIQPNHTNPTGVSTSAERRKEIYRLACKYDILILEDDPYYFLTFDEERKRLPSFLSLDTEGRVLRLDSFSKVVAPGLRVGVLSGPRPLVERVIMHVGCSSLHASTLCQALLARFLTELGHDGYVQHCQSVASICKRQCQVMMDAAEMHLKGLAEWRFPTGGMFLWMKVLAIKDTKRMIEKKALEKMVMCAPGAYFMVDDSKPMPYLRVTFSSATKDEAFEGMRRLKEMILEEMASKGEI